jgi:hypothetical protein
MASSERRILTTHPVLVSCKVLRTFCVRNHYPDAVATFRWFTTTNLVIYHGCMIQIVVWIWPFSFRL